MSSSSSHPLSHGTDSNSLLSSDNRSKESQWSASTPPSIPSVVQPSSSGAESDKDQRSRTPSPILGFSSTTSPITRASDGHFQRFMPAQGPSSEDISMLLGHDWVPPRPSPRSASGPLPARAQKDANHDEDSDVDGDGEWVDHLDLDPHINALMDKDDSPHPATISDNVKNSPQSRDAILLRLQQLGLLPGQAPSAETTPVEQELSQTVSPRMHTLRTEREPCFDEQILYNVLEQVRLRNEDVASSKQLLEFTRKHALSLLSASVVARTHERIIDQLRNDRLQAERDGLHIQCRLLAKRLYESEQIHAQVKTDLEERLSRRERQELAAYLQLSKKVPGVAQVLEKYLLPRNDLLTRYGVAALEESAAQHVEAQDAVPAGSLPVAADVAMAAPEMPPISHSTSAAAASTTDVATQSGDHIASGSSAPAVVSSVVTAASSVLPQAILPRTNASLDMDREGSDDDLDLATLATMPIAQLASERLQLAKDYRQLKSKARDQSAQLHRLSDELRNMRSALVGQGVPASNAAHARTHNKADNAATTELAEERGKGRGSDPTAHFIQRQVWQRERRRKRAAAMGDAAAEHLLLAADRLARIRVEREKQEETDRIEMEKEREEQRARAREELHDRYLDNPSYKMYPYPGESRGQSGKKRRGGTSIVRGGPRGRGRPRVLSESVDRLTRRGDARGSTPPPPSSAREDSSVYFGGLPPRTPGRESHTRGKGPAVDAHLTTPGGSAMSELLQAANSLLSPSKQAKQAREAQARAAQARRDGEADAETSLSFSDDSRIEGNEAAQPFYPNGTPMRSRAGPLQEATTPDANARRKRRRVMQEAEVPVSNIPITPLASQNGVSKGVPFSPLDLLADQAAASSQNAMPGQEIRSRAPSDLTQTESADPGLAAYNPPGASGFRRFAQGIPAPARSIPGPQANPPGAYGSTSVTPAQQARGAGRGRRSESTPYRRSEGARTPRLDDDEEDDDNDDDDELDDDAYEDYEGQHYEETGYEGRDDDEEGEGVVDPDNLTPYYQSRPRSINDHRVPYTRWTIDEDRKLMSAIADYGQKWKLIARRVSTRTYHQCRQRFLLMRRKEAAAAGLTLGGQELPKSAKRRRPGRPRREVLEDENGDEEDEDLDDEDDEGLREPGPSRPTPQSFTSAMASHMASLGAKAGRKKGRNGHMDSGQAQNSEADQAMRPPSQGAPVGMPHPDDREPGPSASNGAGAAKDVKPAVLRSSMAEHEPQQQQRAEEVDETDADPARSVGATASVGASGH